MQNYYIPITIDFDRNWIDPQVAKAIGLPLIPLGHNFGKNYIGESFLIEDHEYKEYTYVLRVDLVKKRNHNLYLPFEYRDSLVVPVIRKKN